MNTFSNRILLTLASTFMLSALLSQTVSSSSTTINTQLYHDPIIGGRRISSSLRVITATTSAILRHRSILPQPRSHTSSLLSIPSLRASSYPSLLQIRGGGTDNNNNDDDDNDDDDGERVQSTPSTTQHKTKRRQRRRRTKNTSTAIDGDTTVSLSLSSSSSSSSGRKAMDEAMAKDVSTAMGDSIRARSENLLQDDLAPHHPISSIQHDPKHHNNNNYYSYDRASQATVTSLRYALGSSDMNNNLIDVSSSMITGNRNRHDYDDGKGGGVEASTSAVIANYFLKSHGGVHSIQSLASLLSVVYGIATLVLVPSLQRFSSTTAAAPTTASSPSLSQQTLLLTMLRRTLLCALAKHLSGFVALASVSASQLPDVGWRETRRRLEALVLDPIAQYIFYCAILFLWTTSRGGGNVGMLPWWLGNSASTRTNGVIVTCLIGPVLVREIVSTLWMISDVLVLLHSSGPNTSTTSTTKAKPTILSVGHATTDAILSLLLKPKTWRNASPATRQRLLATLVGRISLLFEVGTGFVLLVDAMQAFIHFSFRPISNSNNNSNPVRPGVWDVGRRLCCTRLYLNFMLVRRRKIIELMGSIRGGARYVPGRVLDVLLEPGSAMGLHWDGEKAVRGRSGDDEESSDGGGKWEGNTFLEQALLMVGF